MQIKSTVDGAVYKADRLLFAEAVAIEKAVGKPFGKAAQDADLGSALAIQAFVWVAMKRSKPELTFDEVGQMSLEDFEMSSEDEEEEAPADPSPAASKAAPRRGGSTSAA